VLDVLHGNKEQTMKFYQVAIKGNRPQGGLFDTEEQARSEIKFLKADDRRFADDAMREAGIEVKPIEYVVMEVTR
jgi:hypothetical protein